MTTYGATSEEWAHFELVLGLGEDLLPTVCDPSVPISPISMIKEHGRTPSRINHNGQMSGIVGWTQMKANGEIKRWSRDVRLGICIQTRHLRGIDIDVPDPVMAQRIADAVARILGFKLPVRRRQNTGKRLLAVIVKGDIKKSKFEVAGGYKVEFLGTGQMFVAAGARVDGSRYYWEDGLPDTIPEISLEQYDALIAALAAEFAVEPVREGSGAARQEGEEQAGPANGSFFRNVNEAALAHLEKWVPELFLDAKFQLGTKAWRVSSEDLGREFEEDLSIHPTGISDFGLEKKCTAIDLVIEHGGAADAAQAAHWLCEQCGIDPVSIGWQERNKAESGDTASSADRPIWDPWREVAAPAFPLDLLPDDIAEYVEARGIETGACRSAIAMSCLAVASGAISHEARLYLKPGQNFGVAPRLWVLLVGDPSAKKSPAMDGAARPLINYQKQIHAAAAEEWRQEQEAEEDGKGKKSKNRGPNLTHFVIHDTTPEMLADVLSRQDRGTLVIADELAGWLGSLDRYAGGKGASSGRAIWLQAYNGGPFTLLRVSRETLPVNNLSASILGGIQPERLRELGGLTSDGLLQRFLPVMMARSQLDRDGFNTGAFNNWSERVRMLLDYPRFTTELSPEAREERKRVGKLLHSLGQTDSEGAGWQGFVGKLPGVWGSLALLLHVLWGYRAADPVALETAQRASMLLEAFVLPHGLAFYRGLIGTGQADARAIAGFLAGWEQPSIAVRDFVRGPRCCRGLSPDEIVTKLAVFETGGWVAPEKPGPWNRKWTMTPDLGARFSAELTRHRAAVAEVQAKITGDCDD